MEDYLFVLGRDKELSLLELICYFKGKNINYVLKDESADIVVISLDKTNFNIEELGGTVKIAKVICKFKDKNELISSLEKLDLPNKNKVYFSINDDSAKELLIKKFKEFSIKSYYKSNVKDPSSALKLDLELIRFKDNLARVIQISNPKLYKRRDETRPRFDEKKVTSIRLAKILINLSQAKKEIFDPFCGNGTLLQEALLMNLDAYGLDIKIDEAQENLKWLAGNFKIKNRFKLYRGDAGNSSRFIENIEAVVTEPYLGPYLKSYLKYNEALRLMLELENLYKKVFNELNKITGKVVILFPAIPTKDRRKIKVNVKKVISGTEFRDCSYEIKLPIIYKHKGSILEREIWIFEKLKRNI